MAYIDAENILMKTDSLSATVNGAIVDLGSKGAFMSPLYIDAKLTKKLSSGSITSFTLNSSPAEAFTAITEEVKVTVPSSLPQTSRPCTLAQFHAPIKPGNRYIRITANGSSPVGGELYVTMQNGMKVDM